MNSENSVLLLSFKDLFTAKMLKFSILPFILSVFSLYALFFIAAGIGLDSLGSVNIESSQTSALNGVPNTDAFTATLQGAALIQFLTSHAITSWIASFLVYTIGAFLSLYFSLFIALIIIGLLTPTILKELQKRHYSDVEMPGHSNVFEFLFLTLKWLFMTLLMLVAFIPLYFIPIVNIIAFNFPLYFFFHKMMTYDISSSVCTREEAMRIKFFHATTLRLKTLGLYLISLIPFVVLFATVFYVIYLGHSYFLETKKLRAEA